MQTGVDFRPKRLDALTSVRFFFALMVLVGHFIGIHPGETSNIPGWISQLAPQAVSYFFILSGFILTYNFPSLPSHSSRFGFVVSRFARIYPVHAIVTLSLLFIFPNCWQVFLQLPVYFWLNMTLLQSWSTIPFAVGAFNGPSWSISTEWFFYIMFPILLAPNRIVRVLAFLLPAAVAVAATTERGCWSNFSTFIDGGDSMHTTCSTLVFMFPPSRLFEFVAGIVLCQCIRGVKGGSVSQIGLIGFGLLFLCQLVPLPGQLSFASSFLLSSALTLVSGCAIVAALSFSGVISRLLSAKWLVFGGEISFSMYMVHYPILRWLSEHPVISGWPLALQFATVLAFTVAISSALFVFVESPCRSVTKNLLAWTRPLSAVPATG